MQSFQQKYGYLRRLPLLLQESVIAPADLVYSNTGQTMTVGVAITAMSPSSTGGAIVSYSASGLPAGLSINSGTGVITGTPTTATGYSFQITGTNGGGSTMSPSYAVTVAFSPNISGAGLQFWLDASVLGLANNTSVSNWVDLKSGYTSVQAGGSGSTSSPVFKTAQFNGLSAMSFSGSQVLSYGDVLDWGANSATICVVFNKTSSSAGIINKSVAGAADARWTMLYENNNELFAYTTLSTVYGDTGATSNSSTALQCLTLVFDRTAGNAMYRNNNGTPFFSNSSFNGFTMNNAFNLLVGGYPDATGVSALSGYSLAGNICEVLVYFTALGSSDRTAVQSYMCSKWGI